MKITTAITTVQRDVQLQEWSEQIKAQQESGMTVTEYCAQNGINIKTYYYRKHQIKDVFLPKGIWCIIKSKQLHRLN